MFISTIKLSIHVDIHNVRTLSMSTIPIADINKTWTQLYQLSISAIGLALVISKIPLIDKFQLLMSTIYLYCWHQQFNYWYQQFKLSISTKHIHCWYKQFQLWISTIWTINCRFRQYKLSIQLVLLRLRFSDIDIWNCEYQQCTYTTDIFNSNCRYQSYLNARIPIADIVGISDIDNTNCR